MSYCIVAGVVVLVVAVAVVAGGLIQILLLSAA